MSTSKLAGCAAGVMLLALAGCADTDVFSLNLFQAATVPGADGDRCGVASLESVWQSTQAGLRELGIAALATPEDQGVRILCPPRGGARFFLVLTRITNEQGESTRIRLEWDGKPDEQTGSQILARLDAQSRK